MKLILVFSVALSFFGCVKEIDCSNADIKPAFIGFPISDIDTLIIKKFEPGNNYQKLIDSFVVTFDDYYHTSNDTTKIELFRSVKIEAGFDWQIILPALNKTVRIFDIVSNKETIRCPSGALATDKNCDCVNDLISLRIDNQVVTFPSLFLEASYVYIRS